VCTDQLEGDSEYHVYQREGAAGNAHDHSREVAVFRGRADATDGLEISSAALGPSLPHGVMIFRWDDIAAAVKPPLRLNGVAAAGH
jgi:myo-inositol-hexaphosphate 3-phosphohydrolase